MSHETELSRRAGKALRELIEEYYTSSIEFAEDYGLDERTLRRYLNEGGLSKLNMIQELADFFDVPAERYIRDPDQVEIPEGEKALKKQIYDLQAQLEIERVRLEQSRGGSLLKCEPMDYYPGEQADFVLSVLAQAQMRCPDDSRAHDIISSILALNHPVGRGQEILDELKRIFKNGIPTSQADLSALQSLGFSYVTGGKHPKLKFHDKYLFTLPGTPGDNARGGKNMLSEISRCIAISQKI